MASFAQPLDKPPMQPPDVTARTGGGSPASQVGAMLGDKLRQQGAGQQPGAGGPAAANGVHPQGALLARSEAIEQVLTEMGQMNPQFAPFGARALAMIKAGLDAALSAGNNAGATPGAPPPPSGGQDNNGQPAAGGFPG